MADWLPPPDEPLRGVVGMAALLLWLVSINSAALALTTSLDPVLAAALGVVSVVGVLSLIAWKRARARRARAV